MLEDEMSSEDSEDERVEEQAFYMQPTDNNIRSRYHRPHMTLTQRRIVVDYILAMLEEDHLPRGAITKLANKFGVHRSTICKIFKKVSDQRGRGG